MIVADLLKKTVFPDFKLLAGTGGLTRKVNSVSVIDSPDVDRWMRGGEFLVGTGYIFRDNPESMIPFFRLVASRGIAAFGLKIDRYHSKPPQGLIEEAEKLDIPLIEIPLKYRWIDLNDIVYGILLQENKPEMEDGERQPFFSFWQEGLDTSRLLSVFARELGCDLAVASPDLDILNHFAADGTASGAAPAEDIFSAAPVSEKELPRHGSISVRTREIHLEGSIRSVACYTLETSPPIRFALVLPKGEFLPSIHHERMILRALAMLRGAMLEASFSFREKKGQKEQFLQNLCLGTYNNSDMVQSRARELGIEIPREIVVMEVSSTERDKLPLWRPPFPLSYSIANHWVSVTDFDELQHRMNELRETARDQGLWIILGSMVEGWENIQKSYEEAKRTLNWIREFEPAPGIYRYGELSLQTLLSKMVELPEANGVWQRFWAPLIMDSSKRRAVPLSEVAKALVRSDFNGRECTKLLHLHYNTVRNYIAELEDILRIDLKKRLHRMALILGYCIHCSKEHDSWQDIF